MPSAPDGETGQWDEEKEDGPCAHARAHVRGLLSLSHCPISLINEVNQMNKAGQNAGTEAGREKAESHLPIADEITSVPWVPRTDGKTALLVSERTTVFDRKAVL